MPKKLTNEEQRRQPLRCGRLVRPQRVFLAENPSRDITRIFATESDAQRWITELWRAEKSAGRDAPPIRLRPFAVETWPNIRDEPRA